MIDFIKWDCNYFFIIMWSIGNEVMGVIFEI